MNALLSRLWRGLPLLVRQVVLLLTQTTFTVGVSAVVLDTEDRVLLFRHYLRSIQGWALPGGFVGRGESLENALCRELQEEAQLTVRVVALLEARIAEAHHLDICYLARVVDGELQIDTNEVRAGAFFSLDALPPMLDATTRRMIALASRRLIEPA
jgi:ADP-ribose pyrophosphatase YjhB (NUDIX family)